LAQTGYQLFAGVNYALNNHWAIQSEIRYGTINGLKLGGEAGNPGNFSSLDYDTMTLQFGVVYNF